MMLAREALNSLYSLGLEVKLEGGRMSLIGLASLGDAQREDALELARAHRDGLRDILEYEALGREERAALAEKEAREMYPLCHIYAGREQALRCLSAHGLRLEPRLRSYGPDFVITGIERLPDRERARLFIFICRHSDKLRRQICEEEKEVETCKS